MRLIKPLASIITISTFLALNLSLQTSAELFSDVTPGEPHYVAINYLQQQGVIEGYQDGTFKPYQKVNRAEALKMLTIASGLFEEGQLQSEENPSAPFTDTPPFAWYTKYLTAAKEKGIIEGYEDGSYRPDSNVNRIEALKIFLESFEELVYPDASDYKEFADASTDAWYSKYVAFSAQRGMISVSSKNEIFPETEMTRGQLAELIYRKTLSDFNYQFGKASYYGEYFDGRTTASGEIFDMTAMTAAHLTLPFGTMVEVTNLATGDSVQVKITDRGPYGHGRIIDLSQSAFEAIAPLSRGLIQVQVQPL